MGSACTNIYNVYNLKYNMGEENEANTKNCYKYAYNTRKYKETD